MGVVKGLTKLKKITVYSGNDYNEFDEVHCIVKMKIQKLTYTGCFMEGDLVERNLNNHTEQDNQIEYVEVWEDLVSIRDLVISLIICVVTTLGLYFVAPNNGSMPLLLGLFGALLGFGICSFIFKPKRNFIEDKEGK